MKLLILCTGNSCRSQIAEGFMRHHAQQLKLNVEVVSAGIETHGLNPNAVRVMAEANIDISKHTSDLLDKYLNTGITHVLTVCDSAKDKCPYFPESVHLTHHSFPDPAKATGTTLEVEAAFREVRDAIDRFSLEYLQENSFP